MIYVIISIDPSTNFLFEIVDNLKSNDFIKFVLVEIHPNDISYQNSFESISKFEKNSIVLFLGHGQPNQIYGGEIPKQYLKKPIVKLNEMSIFQDQSLFLLACNSSELIKSSFRYSKFVKSIGFGGLPTSIEEIQKDKKLSLEDISNETIEEFKKAIVETVSESLIYFFKRNDNDFIFLKDYLILLIDKKINESIFLKNNRSLADLLFRMRNEMVIY